MNLKQFSLSLATVVLLANCSSKHTNEVVRTAFLDKAGMDTTANPADDFAQYANGTWLKNTKIPDDQSGWGSFYTLNEENQKKTKAILEALAATSAQEGATEQKVGDFYASGMDTLAIEKVGVTPVLATLKTIEAIKTPQAYLDYVAADQDNLGGALFSFYVGADDKNSTRNRINFSQAGLGLPEKSYYTSDEPSTKKVREAYLAYITTLLKLSGVEATLAAKQAQEVLAFEKALSVSHKTPVELRDPIKNYHKYAIADLAKVYPMNWASFLQKMQVKTDSVLIGQPEYYTAMGKLLATTPIEIIKNREKINVLNAASPYLTKAFRTARFEFYGKVLNGQQVEAERWKKMANQVDANLGELLGQIWVKKHFTPEAKERMLTLVTNLQKVYRSRIEKLDWMSKETKDKALVKFDKIINKIGYPDKWKNFDDVTINRATYYANVLSASRHATKEILEKLGKPVDKTEWGMTPPTVNAYANPSFNEIVFPAGILQFPFFDNNADDAINYGGIGGVIGHELTHLFDDQGRQYDADGNLKDWWKEDDAKKFNAKAQLIVNQYNNFALFGNVHVNGQLTLGENLADLGGVTLAYEAFKLTEQGKANEKIDGFTPDQRFFMSWAQVWRIKDREESMRVRLKADPHSPEVFRINGPLMNFEPFYKAFNVNDKNKMYLPADKRAVIW